MVCSSQGWGRTSVIQGLFRRRSRIEWFLWMAAGAIVHPPHLPYSLSTTISTLWSSEEDRFGNLEARTPHRKLLNLSSPLPLSYPVIPILPLLPPSNSPSSSSPLLVCNSAFLFWHLSFTDLLGTNEWQICFVHPLFCAAAGLRQASSGFWLAFHIQICFAMLFIPSSGL
jgi:hypothetical protein